MTHRHLLLILLFALTGPAAADGRVLEVIPLRHALVDDIVPMLRELVSPGGTVTGMRDQLIIRTTPANLADLKNVLAALDRPLRRLRISVRQDVGREYQWQEDELAARITAGDVTAGVGGPQDGPGAHVRIGEDGNRIAYRNYSTRGSEDDAHAHFVTALEGRPALISTGQVVPLANRQLVPGPYGVTAFDSIEYRNVGSGFYVTPRLNGETVSLEISPYADKLARQGGGIIDSRGVETTVSGPLGTWIALGGAGQSAAATSQGIVHRTRGAESGLYDVWVKVDIVP